jgi:hypothetical protein
LLRKIDAGLSADQTAYYGVGERQECHRAVVVAQTNAAAPTQPASCATRPSVRPADVKTKERWLGAIDRENGRIGSIIEDAVDLFQELSGVERLAKQGYVALNTLEMSDRIHISGNHQRSTYQVPLL